MKYKVLLVDDSAVNRNFLKMMFLQHSYDVMETDRGVEVFEIIESTVPDIMLLDLYMPGIDGLETLKGIRAKGYTFPIVIFTSDDKEETRNKCLAAGANELLYKPSKPSLILNLVQKILSATPR
jgi:CheY-like chemotaxis protein